VLSGSARTSKLAARAPGTHYEREEMSKMDPYMLLIGVATAIALTSLVVEAFICLRQR
jgi:hypothetical protein